MTTQPARSLPPTYVQAIKSALSKRVHSTRTLLTYPAGSSVTHCGHYFLAHRTTVVEGGRAAITCRACLRALKKENR